MRRLIAHIGLALSALVLVGTTYNNVVSTVDSNIEFKNGEQLVFRASHSGINDAEEDISDETLTSITKEMENRLEKSNVSRYRVIKEGKDTIKVVLARENQSEYEKIKTYLSFNGSFALTTSTDIVALGSEFLQAGKAYLDDIQGYPAVVIPFDNDSAAYKAVYEEAKRQKEAGEGEVTHHDHDGEEEEEVTTYMYFWYDYIEGYDTYEKTVSSNSEYDQAVADKILMKFNFDDPYMPKDKEDDADKLYSAINIDADGNGTASAAEVKSAYNTARYFVNLLNASELAAHVEFIYSTPADLWVDEILSMNTHLTAAFSATLKATLVGVVLVALLLIFFYRLGALSIGTISIASSYLGICILSWLGIEFSVAALVGVFAIAIASLASGIVYANKLKEECYRGRSLKKANSEALRRSTLPIVDIHVVLIVLGAFAYVLGGPLMKSFAAVTVLGGLASLILNTFGLAAMMWLATNGTFVKEKYELFGVAKEQVPNLMNEEKQTFFGEYADKDYTKNKKSVGIIATVLAIGCLAGTIVSGVLKQGEVYKQASTVVNSEIYLEMETTADDNDVLESETRERFMTIADDIVYEEKALSTYVDQVNLYTRKDVVTTKDGPETIYYSYYVVSLTKDFKGSEEVSYNNTTYVLTDLFSDDHVLTLGFNAEVSLSIKDGKVVSKDQPNFVQVILGTGVGVAVAFVYLMLRYRLSRGISTLVITLGAGLMSAGIFALIPLGVGAYVVLATPVTCLIAMILSIFINNKERELIIEDKTHNRSVENRNEIMVNATRLSCTPVIVFLAIISFLTIILFGFGPMSTTYIFLNIIFGTLVATIMAVCLLGPVGQFFYKLFFRVRIERPTKKSKKTKVLHKSAEPEEAIFIGIND